MAREEKTDTAAALPSGGEPTDQAKIPLDELEKQLHASEDGLSSDEAQKRLEQYGRNELREKSVNPLLKFLSYFWGPIPWMIEVAAILSVVVRHWADFFIILALLLMNSVVGFWEEYQAGNAIAALKAKLAPQARVKRDNAWKMLPAGELVPGDIIRLRLGDIIPADARLLDGESIQVDQSALTGESLPVEHKAGDSVYSGSVIRKGETEGLVYATGEQTYFGKTAHLVGQAGVKSHFQRAVLKIGDYLIVIALVLVLFIIAVALYRGDKMLTTIEFALVLTVAAVPVAMPAVLSVTMAVGARLLAKKEAIVSRLASIEELAGIDVLCSDKTGTLTQNTLTLGDPFCVDDYKPEQVIVGGALASRKEDNDPIDLAVLTGVKDSDRLDDYHVTHFTPFDPVHKRTEAEVTGQDGKSFKVSKGAPQVILELCGNPGDINDDVQKAIEDFAGRGFRSLGVARADNGDDWKFLGILPLYDPPREDSAETIATARKMGIKMKMVTGDQVAIGKEIAREVGMGTNILDAGMFAEVKHHETRKSSDAIVAADGFAQVFPEHKYHIVDVLQQRGHIVGMTGDGVNDAPALKEADAGIAVSGATDAARAASDIVLLSPGLSVIIDAIRESRKIFKRMNSYAIYRIAETIRVLLFMTLSIIVFNFYPVTAVMIVLLALLNDGAILSIAYDRTLPSNYPEAWRMKTVLGVSTMLGLMGVVESFGLFFIAERVFHLDQDTIRSLIYLKLSVAGHLTVFVARTRHRFWSIRPANILLGAVLVTQAVATLITVYGIFMSPIGWQWAGLVWAYALVWFFIEDQVKILGYNVFEGESSGWYSSARKK